MLKIAAMMHLIVMPTLMLAFFVLALSAPQLGLFNGMGLWMGAIGSFIVGLPVSWYVAKEVVKQTKKQVR